ncbi:hypothetical protein DENSPDRAFT_298144 [Dentipellis sp. KUC8613]|nr:hypothetical protein DENSPDRAFT_298144 [Dentipellis sp. KUC8613]
MGCWTFVPPPEVLRTILQRLLFLRSNHINAPWDIVYPPSTTNRYQLVPLKLANTVITRLHAPRTDTPHPVVPALYLSPYLDFPALGPSSAHPYFVIHEALAHLDAHAYEREMDEPLLRVYSALVHVRALWRELARWPVKRAALDLPGDLSRRLDAKGEPEVLHSRSRGPASPERMSVAE